MTYTALLSFFQENTYAFILLAGLLGFIAGSLLYPCIHYIPAQLEKNWHIQAWQQLYPYTPLPSLSFYKIRYSWNIKKSIRIAFLFSVLSIIIAYYFGPCWLALAQIFLMWGLLLLACIDYQTQILPDCISLPLLWLGLCCNIFTLCAPLQEAVLGAIIGYSSLFFIAACFRYVRNKEGIGRGDFKLLALFGAWWGWHPLFFIMTLASILGATSGVIQLAKGHAAEKPIAFGPYLIFAAFISLFIF